MATEDLVRLPLAAVVAGDNPRKTFDETALADLARSIQTLGQQAPVIVRLHPTRPEVYQLVDGERRWRACHAAGVETVLCLVRELDDRAALEVALVANSARSDVHPLEESDALVRLIAMGSDVEDLRGRMNRGEQWVRDRLALEKLVPELRARLAAADMPLRAAVILAHLPPARQVDVAVNSRAWPMSVKEAMRRAAGDTPRPLSTALWDLSDPTAGGRGACSGCIYRTDTQPELLGDEATKAKCMDAACWAAKGEKFLAARAAQGATIIRNEFPGYDTPTLDTPAWLLDRALERAGLPTPEGQPDEDAPHASVSKPETWATRLPEAEVTYVVTPHGDIRPVLTRASMAKALTARGLPEVAAIIDPPPEQKGAKPSKASKPPRAKPKDLAGAVEELLAVVDEDPAIWITDEVLANELASWVGADQARAVARQLGLVPKDLGYLPHWIAGYARTCPGAERNRLLALMILGRDLADAGNQPLPPGRMLVRWLKAADVALPEGLVSE